MPGTEILRMEHIRKVYSNGVVANSDITFAVNHGEIHALSGENGASCRDWQSATASAP